ncbi:putative TATA element modulatory factor 1, TATA binding protein [Helianthus annuus]|uniref:Putative golgin candidate 5 n=1 Tax=Helianthus annuus TaxID=4232 RepID=A0A251UXL6_HELAN|nr:golgin candidate 5 isoform X1 [Helianthus annuus]XP_035845575.1 golgin candidate 5 isoform X1 [Helianthus annuus]KAF5808059.1 putative TATA element modulatory factor 1, TATA binding protein [Helianthus annuus]KAJ0595242.1 putative TATA element modulatory factor 1, TATA binding protein [Helianthus annuus]KAJ0759704.1 putative TATA element modulatory factor 1, TATA binding protein [Helianthus annuus]KAJ0924802.1 putative TATA element modulatory factor 1, TATA binding protein [Helianthus annuu
MAWFSGKVTLGNFADIAGAVNKFSESVKNIEKNFDSALGFEDKAGGTTSTTTSTNEASGSWPTDIMAFMGQKKEDSTAESIEKVESSGPQSSSSVKEKEVPVPDNLPEENLEREEHESHPSEIDISENPQEINIIKSENSDGVASSDNADNVASFDNAENVASSDNAENIASSDSADKVASSDNADDVASSDNAENVVSSDNVENVAEQSNIAISDEATTTAAEVDSQAELNVDRVELSEFVGKSESIVDESTDGVDQVVAASELNEVHPTPDLKSEEASHEESVSAVEVEKPSVDGETGSLSEINEGQSVTLEEIKVAEEGQLHLSQNPDDVSVIISEALSKKDDSNSMAELEKVTREMKMMEAALLGAARQAQAKADEIAKLMQENEQLKSIVEDQRRKPSEADIESLREEYHQRVSTLERKVYALTKERDTLRREQNKKSDAAALLKEKDEIITQIMAEGEGLSKKQAVQESQIRKLRAQIRELEEEKKGLMAKLQVEESKVESIKRDKAATEKLLQLTIEKNQAELATQKEYYTNALNAAKEAEALAEARANSEAKTEVESRLKEAEEREVMLVQTLEELRQTLSRTEQQAVFREDMLRRDVEDLQKRYQESERRCEELVMQVPDSTRPLLRQIEAMQETNARRAEAWTAVERSLNSRLQEAEAKAAAAEERERSVNERLSQTLSRINVLEAQISILRGEQTQLAKSLEKERQKAAENRQEYLALKEEADTHKDRVNQLEEEIRELKRKHKQDLQEALTHRELLQQDIEREKAARLELETTTRLQNSIIPEQSPLARTKSAYENGLARRLSNASSLGSMEESFYLQASLDSSDTLSERRNNGEPIMSSYYLKSMTPNAFEAALRQKEGELASYMSRLASMESIRDSLAEELVKMTEECEKLRSEVSQLPGLKADIEALRRRHSAALELMGERDEELEELRADIVDLKEMYREQVNMLVNKIQVLSSSITSA